MKLVAHFDTFFTDVVNINDTRLTPLNDSVESIKTFIRGSSWEPRIRGFAAQGSWAHKTIIKPVAGRPFDADILVYVDPVKGWSAKSYIDELYEVFRSNGTYKDKVRRFSHCVTIEYAGERKIDIAPCVKDRQGWINWEVCNRISDGFEQSNPLDYTRWLTDRNGWSGSHMLRKVTRLLKYLRDIKTTFTCPSFLFSTLLGYEIRQGDSGTVAFADVPTALKTIIDRLDDFLQLNESKPTVTNPVLPSETISDAWSDDQYKNFRSRINTYRGWIDDAYDETDRDESIRKWQRVFGDSFAPGVVAATKSALVKALDAAADLVTDVIRRGLAALPLKFNQQPHMTPPRWSPARGQAPLPFLITATLYKYKAGDAIRRVESLDPLSPGHWLRFEVFSRYGAVQFGRGYDVHWRVTNTGQAASRELRGGFYASDATAVKWESLKYRGVHMVEAFVVRQPDGALVGHTEPFYVVIE